MPRKKAEIQLPVTREDLDDALSMLKGTAIEIEPGSKVIRSSRKGFQVYEREAWIKFSVAFRNGLIAKMRGAALPVFIVLALHIDDNNECFPALETIAKESGWGRTSVIHAVERLMKMNLVGKEERPGRSPVYRILAGVAYGEGHPRPVQNLNGSDTRTRARTGTRTRACTTPVHARVPEEEPVGRTIEGEPGIAGTGTPPPAAPPGPAPSGKGKGGRAKKEPDPRSASPQVQAVRSLQGTYPPVILYDEIIQAVGARSKEDLTPYYKAWRAKGYNPTNLAWLFDWSVNGIPGNGNGRSNGANGSGQGKVQSGGNAAHRPTGQGAPGGGQVVPVENPAQRLARRLSGG